MAHFAELNDNDIVIRVIVVSNENIKDENGHESESVGIAFLQRLFSASTKWAQTSYNARFRGVYTGPGMRFDRQKDLFVPVTPEA
jgi:hypothetical protein